MRDFHEAFTRVKRKDTLNIMININHLKKCLTCDEGPIA